MTRNTRSEEEFLVGLAARGVTAQPRKSKTRPGEVTGYSFGLASDTTGVDGGPVWFGGSKLAPDLSLSRLRARWPGGPGQSGLGRLSGRAMSRQAARPVLAREVTRAARAARGEEQFFALLGRAGLLVSLRPDPDRPGRAAGYAVSLPVCLGQAAQCARPGPDADVGPGGRGLWIAGGDLGQHLGLGRLRARWTDGRAGAVPGSDLLDEADARHVYAYAAAVAQRAAGDLRAARPRDRAGIAWAAADLITSAAVATGNPELRRAADGFRRAARAPRGRAPADRSPAGAMIRTAAYALAGCAPVARRSAVRRALTAALTLLVRAVAEMRRDQMLLEQASRAREERARQLRAARAPQAPGRQPQVRNLQVEDAARAATEFARAAGPTWGADPAAAAAAAASQSAPRSRPTAPAPARRRPSAPRR